MLDDGIIRKAYPPKNNNRRGRPPGVKNGDGKMGRPSSFLPEIHIPIAHHLALMGCNEDEIIRACNTSVATFHKWKRDFPEFLKALKTAKLPVTDKVVRRLL